MRLKSMAISPYLEKSRFTAMDEARLHDLEPAYVKRALQYIEDNLDKKLLVQSIADHCRVSRRTLEVSFRHSRSCSIGEYIRQSRIHLAAESLLTTDQSIGQISSRLGYSSPLHIFQGFFRPLWDTAIGLGSAPPADVI